MSQAMDYALRIPGRSAWSDLARDVCDGAIATGRLVVTVSGCAALAAAALLFSHEGARGHLTSLLPTTMPSLSTAQVPAAIEEDVLPDAAPLKATVDPRQEHVVKYLARRYRVADEAVRVLVSAAFEIGQHRKLDPLLILSVVAIESSLNPFAESAMGAQGLMQVMTRVHSERFGPHGGDIAALDPIANMKVGSAILHELIARGGSVERGLQLYVGAGNQPDDGGYGARVLGERSRMQLAAAGKVDAAIAAAMRPPTPVEPKPATVGAVSTVAPSPMPAVEAAEHAPAAPPSRPDQAA